MMTDTIILQFMHLSRQSSSVEGTGMLERRVSPELVEAGDPLSI